MINLHAAACTARKLKAKNQVHVFVCCRFSRFHNRLGIFITHVRVYRQSNQQEQEAPHNGFIACSINGIQKVYERKQREAHIF